MAMTRKQFQMIADIVRGVGGENRKALADTFAANLRHENPRFDRERFVAACLPEPDDIITVHGYERLNNSANGNPRYKLLANGGALLTSSDAACNNMIENGWEVFVPVRTRKTQRQASITRTPAGRVATLVWLDGDN